MIFVIAFIWSAVLGAAYSKIHRLKRGNEQLEQQLRNLRHRVDAMDREAARIDALAFAAHLRTDALTAQLKAARRAETVRIMRAWINVLNRFARHKQYTDKRDMWR